MKRVRSTRRLGRWAPVLFALSASVVGVQACNTRFEFDVPSGGSGGSAASAGAAGARAGAGAGGAIAGAAGAPAGAAGLVASGGGCGVHPQCPAPLHCVGGECSECSEDADCTNAARPRCDESNRCVGCLLDSDCSAGFICDSNANRCLQHCTVKADCPVTAHGCDDDRHVCYQCDEDRECSASTLGPRCASDGSACVQCRGDADCPMQHCDVLVGRCVECRDWRDCASGLCTPGTGVCAEFQ